MRDLGFEGSKTLGLKILEADKTVINDNCLGYGEEMLEVSIEDMQQLLDGKVWCFPVNDGEYTHFVILKE